MKILKTFWLSVVLLGISLICGVSYYLIGSSVDDDGFLVEPFGFIPLFWLFLLLAVVSFVVTRIRAGSRRNHDDSA
ncbi:DUF3955 domain-containing protein [Photobacterium atrarenae]|uniref:DUF3955 domain-containing protein n=1 Tax=Photobacterium atrarenae TaxID=865757 RepID=A0ABY5GJT6_9GAMM|nr:DUF3955 domain-containing protein [Photobacterium atrarenae]UTV29178.1 DUF3955 domain-containing protein [Photobacterium atrarenae]